MTSAVSLGLLVLLEAQIYHNYYRSGTNRSRFLVVFNILLFCASTPVSDIRSWRVTLVYVCVFVLLPILSYMYTQRVLNK